MRRVTCVHAEFLRQDDDDWRFRVDMAGDACAGGIKRGEHRKNCPPFGLPDRLIHRQEKTIKRHTNWERKTRSIDTLSSLCERRASEVARQRERDSAAGPRRGKGHPLAAAAHVLSAETRRTKNPRKRERTPAHQAPSPRTKLMPFSIDASSSGFIASSASFSYEVIDPTGWIVSTPSADSLTRDAKNGSPGSTELST